MGLRIFLLLCILIGAGNASIAQPLFLPTGLNTSKKDVPVAFAEHQGKYYFAGTQWPTQPGEASHGFCYRTDSAGNVLQTFQLNGTDSQRAYRFKAVYPYNDQIYILASVSDTFKNRPFLLPAYPNNELQSGFYFNKLLLIRLDNTLAVRRVDTLSYDTDSTDLFNLKSVLINGKLFAAYGGIRQPAPTSSGYKPRAFLTAYNLNTGSVTHQPMDSTFLLPLSTSGQASVNYSNHCLFTSLTRTGDNRMIVIVTPIYPNGIGEGHTAVEIDTNLVIQKLPFAPGYNFQNQSTGFYPEYTELWRPTATSSYFVGPLFQHTDGATGICSGVFNLARLDSPSQTVLLGNPVPLHPSRPENYWAARTSAMTLLRDQKHFILTSDAYTATLNGSVDSARIRIAKYDTSLNLLWNRDFGRPYGVFNTAGVHELSNAKLMVISSMEDGIAGGTVDLHCFILDTAGTPLSTFMVAAPGPNSVKIYPNPAQSEIRFQLPTGVAGATYLISDLGGKIVQQGSVISGNPVSVNTLPAANYLFRVQTPDGVFHSGMFTKQ